MLHKCKCGGTLYAIDNEPLNHDKQWLKEVKQSVDHQVYVKMQCDTCLETSTKVFELNLITNKA